MADQNSSLLAHLLAKGYSLDDINDLINKSKYTTSKSIPDFSKASNLPNPLKGINVLPHGSEAITVPRGSVSPSKSLDLYKQIALRPSTSSDIIPVTGKVLPEAESYLSKYATNTLGILGKVGRIATPLATIGNLYGELDEDPVESALMAKAKSDDSNRKLAAETQAIDEFDKQNKTELPDYLSNSQSSDGLALSPIPSAKVRAEAPKGVDYGEQFGPPAPSKGVTSPSKPKSDSDLFKMAAGGFTDDTVNALSDTQKLQAQAVLANQLGKASELIGSGFSRVKPQAQEIFDSNIKQSENIVKDYLQRAKQEESDPSSTKSQFARESMRRLGIQVPENVAFDAIEKAFPKFVQMKGLEEQVAQRREAAAARAEEMKLRREELAATKGEKQKETNEKFTQSLRKELTAGEIGKARANYMTARKAEDALSAFAKDPTGYTDYGSLMLGLKALQGDQSVVREAEIRLGKNAASLFQKAENAIQGAMTGKSLQPEQRKAIADSVGHLSQIAKRQYQELASPIVTQAKSQGYDLNKILDKKAFPEFFGDEEKQESAKKASSVSSNEVIRMTKNGRKAAFDPNTKTFLRWVE